MNLNVHNLFLILNMCKIAQMTKNKISKLGVQANWQAQVKVKNVARNL